MVFHGFRVSPGGMGDCFEKALTRLSRFAGSPPSPLGRGERFVEEPSLLGPQGASYRTLTIIDLPRRPSLNSSLLAEIGVLTPCTDTWVQ